jgi:segregation and condensation protein A
LVEALKEQMRIKEAADRLAERPWLDRDVFTRAAAPAEVKQVMAKGPEVLAAGVFDLIEAFRRLLCGRAAQLTLSTKRVNVTLEKRMDQLLDLLRGRKTLLFEECFSMDSNRATLVVTFLALLELTRLGLIKVYQERAAAKQAGQTLPAEPIPPVAPSQAIWSPLRLYFNYKAQERWVETPG